MARFKIIAPMLGLTLAFIAWGQSSIDQNSTTDQKQDHKWEPGAARELGAAAGAVGTGAVKGTGDVAKGTTKAAADVVTLHPIDAGVSVGKGATNAGKDVTVGTAKGVRQGHQGRRSSIQESVLNVGVVLPLAS